MVLLQFVSPEIIDISGVVGHHVQWNRTHDNVGHAVVIVTSGDEGAGPVEITVSGSMQ